MGRMVRHMRGSKPEHGYFEIDVNSLPVRDCSCNVCINAINNKGRRGNQGKGNYGRGSTSGGYGRSSYSMRAGVFDGLPSLSRKRDDGAIEIFYQAGSVDLDDEKHGHAVIKNGRLIYKRRPGESTPVIDLE
jgi:hypothetical protein